MARAGTNKNCELPQPPASNPQPPRSALSLTEVLIAMGILTIGLLGVASVFPVASYYMQKAETTDISAAVAQQAMNDLISRGMLDPWGWFVMSPTPDTGAVGDPNYRFLTIDGKYAPSASGTTSPKPSSFTRPFGEALEAGEKLAADVQITSGTPMNETLSRQFGNAYVIDPIGIAAVQNPQGVTNGGRIMYGFPSASFMVYPGTSATYYSNALWNTWRANTQPPKQPGKMTWPIRRVTFRQSSTGWNLDKAMADYYCAYSDDLSYDFPERDDRPSQQLWSTANGSPLSRQWKGDYSWIATVAPVNSDGRNSMATAPNSVTCDVSVVVLYKRPLPSDQILVPADYPEAMTPERSVGVSIISTGLNGGELLLRDLGDGLSSAFTNLKVGNWMLLCGPHPNSTVADPRFVLNWYQILTIEANGDLVKNPTTQRVVAVRGPQWPWLPASTTIWDYSQLSNDLCGGIIKGAVAVHTKTVAMQTSRRNGIEPMGTTGEPGTVRHPKLH